ncbi:MAG: sugar phosphate isomerase/epimerase and 4-hydroxyphenylpyruvate domain-containing protein [Solirubrobacterales bacterium]|nr:sugar phosphate isomerase/epimerase and 4-hydroxyphenylpyruvate domain-containing protein [Solirubrobacterales bacterium]MBV9943180.1 sugar phosphate isomerase/epimerase and 4-hydroxyphenylpyruvate domain-containing protein [Solirubrobacterales bacterium]
MVRTGIATVCLSGTLEDKLAAAAQAGFDGVEVFEPDLIGSPLSPSEIRILAAELGLSIDLYQPFRDFESVPNDQLERNLRRAEAKFDVVEALGAETMLVCSNVSDDAIDDDGLAAQQLHALADRAAERGVRIAYEALAWGRHVSQYDHAWRIVQAVDHPALGICLDSFHILSRGTSLAAIADIPADKLFFVQLADAPHLVMDVLQWSRHYRSFPGQGGFDLADFTARVLDAGYAGPLSLEVFNDVFRQADPRRMAIDAMRSLLTLQESLQAGRSRHLPPPASLHGYAFVELAVEPSSVGETQRLMHAMGFVQAAQHRSKPVALWQHRGVRMLLNAGAPGAPGIAAIAVESADADRSAERAQALLAPVLSRQRSPGEADLSAIAAPDGTSVFFCRTDTGSDTRGWLQDFDPLAPIGRSASTGLIRIDHVALAQPFDYFDEAALFYRSLLGLEPRESLELAAPDGLVRSRAVSAPNGSVRLVLTVPVLAHDAAQPAGLQHVAIACGDIFLVAQRMRERGVGPLSIPDNYYDDLAARLDLEPDLIEVMREHYVLYDRTPGGEFLHFYTPIVGDRLFFEVVERRGDYDGYGAANAPIRMTAQRAPAMAKEAAFAQQGARAKPAEREGDGG